MYKLIFKRSIDFLVALILLALLLPILLLLSIVLFIANKGSVFYTQQRPAKNERIIKVLKFKTMSDLKDLNGKLLSDQERITPIGKFIRSTSADELPQLLNVLKGDMSLVGPRPLLVKYLPLYTEEQKRRHSVRPGITGWAQVNGRNTITWAQKFEHDIWYINHLSFLLDLKIIWLTIQKVFKRDGIAAVGTSSASAFNGHN